MPRWKSSGSARSGQSVIWTRWWRNCSMWFRRTRTSRLRRTMESCSVRMDISDTDRSITKKCGKCRLWKGRFDRSEEHTSELQSPCNLVCRLLLEKKKKESVITRHSRGPQVIYAHHQTSTYD